MCGLTCGLDADAAWCGGNLEEEGGGRSFSRGSISSMCGKMFCHEFEISAVAP